MRAVGCWLLLGVVAVGVGVDDGIEIVVFDDDVALHNLFRNVAILLGL